MLAILQRRLCSSVLLEPHQMGLDPFKSRTILLEVGLSLTRKFYKFDKCFALFVNSAKTFLTFRKALEQLYSGLSIYKG